jgi:hypothetical protein
MNQIQKRSLGILAALAVLALPACGGSDSSLNSMLSGTPTKAAPTAVIPKGPKPSVSPIPTKPLTKVTNIQHRQNPAPKQKLAQKPAHEAVATRTQRDMLDIKDILATAKNLNNQGIVHARFYIQTPCLTCQISHNHHQSRITVA